MRSLLIATCLTVLGGAPRGFASGTVTKPQAAVSHEATSTEGAKPATTPKASEATSSADAKKDPAKNPEAKTLTEKLGEQPVSASKAEASKGSSSKGVEETPAVGKTPDGKTSDSASITEGPKPEEAKGTTIVEMKTSEGTIRLELADREAPVTVKNFLSYVNDKFYDGTIFHRVIDDFMIQGGGYVVEGEKLVEKTTKAPIINEAKNGLKNNRGTIAMARMKDPNSATAQFYINQVNNNNLDYPSFDGHGYAVFGKVIDGIDVVDKIAKSRTGVKGGMPDVPLADVKILSVQVVRATGH